MARLSGLAATAAAVAIGALVAEAGVDTLVARGATIRYRGCPNTRVPASRLSKPALRAAVVCLIDAERVRHGLPRLRESSRLDRGSQRWADSMVVSGNFTHGSGAGAHVSAAGLRWSAAGETIATGFATPRGVVAAWMADAGHCQIILSPLYTMVGTGINRHPVKGFATGGATWAEDFVLPAGRRALSHNWGPSQSCH